MDEYRIEADAIAEKYAQSLVTETPELDLFWAEYTITDEEIEAAKVTDDLWNNWTEYDEMRAQRLIDEEYRLNKTEYLGELEPSLYERVDLYFWLAIDNTIYSKSVRVHHTINIGYEYQIETQHKENGEIKTETKGILVVELEGQGWKIARISANELAESDEYSHKYA